MAVGPKRDNEGSDRTILKEEPAAGADRNILKNCPPPQKNNLKEVIIATSATVEGQTTAHYIEDTIKNDKIKITKLAQGLPVGGEIEQLDDGTLLSAFKNRTPVTES